MFKTPLLNLKLRSENLNFVPHFFMYKCVELKKENKDGYLNSKDKSDNEQQK